MRGATILREELARRLAQPLVLHALVDLNHLPADGQLIHPARQVFVVAMLDGGNDLRRDESLLHLPVEEVRARVARPERAVAIEDGNRRTAGKHLLHKLNRTEAGSGMAQNNGSCIQIRTRNSLSWPRC